VHAEGNQGAMPFNLVGPRVETEGSRVHGRLETTVGIG